MFRFEKAAVEWKERGTGDVKLLKDRKGGKVRVVMRRDKTLKVCANFMSESRFAPLLPPATFPIPLHLQPYSTPLVLVLVSRAVTSDMKLAPNLGSDRAWVWNVSADYAESEPTAETFAIRFANTESELPRSYLFS